MLVITQLHTHAFWQTHITITWMNQSNACTSPKRFKEARLQLHAKVIAYEPMNVIRNNQNAPVFASQLYCNTQMGHFLLAIPGDKFMTVLIVMTDMP